MYTGGYMGKILWLDLTKQEFRIEPLAFELARDYMGGAGLGIRLLYDLVPAHTDPLGPGNILVLAPGPLTGTSAPTASRMAIVTRSPLTGTVGMAVTGGQFPAELKFAGYDAVVVEGVADAPVYVSLQGERVRFHSAKGVWGTNTCDCEVLIQEELHDRNTRVACIGPAGERGSLISAIINERRAAGRKGVGAVMGAKKLKAIAVRGSEKVQVADEGGYGQARSTLLRLFKDNQSLYPGFSRYGTSNCTDTMEELGIYPVHNFAATGEYRFADKMGGYVQEADVVRTEGCYRCPVACHIFRMKRSGPYAGMLTDGPEYETDYSFGGMVGVADPGAIYAADRMCDDYGLDTMSTGAVIAFAMELFEKGLLTKADTGGLELRFGNDAAVIAMVRQIAFREGLGDLLADGVKRASEQLGPETQDYALHVKGLELPGYDVRGAISMGLNYATTYVGSDHNRGYASQEVFGASDPISVDRFALDNKAALTKWNQDMKMALCDCPTTCAFTLSVGAILDRVPEGLGDELTDRRIATLTKLIGAATGIPYSPPEIRALGERVNTLARAFNAREGFTRKDDTLPRRLMEEPIKAGPSKGHIFTQEMLDRLLDEYYGLYGYDERGIPTRDRLELLGLGPVAGDLAQLGLTLR